MKAWHETGNGSNGDERIDKDHNQLLALCLPPLFSQRFLQAILLLRRSKMLPGNGQGFISVLLLIFFSMILPAIVMYFDEELWVNEIEKEQREHDSGTLGHA
jgi:membrane glycosyltransferase